MTSKEFNEKYKDYLEERHYGCDVHNENQITFLDNIFQKYILIPGFSYAQIKYKFGGYRFYCKGLPDEICYKIENELKSLEDEYYEPYYTPFYYEIEHD